MTLIMRFPEVSLQSPYLKVAKSGAGEPKKQCFARESVLIDTHYISPKYPLPDTN